MCMPRNSLCPFTAFEVQTNSNTAMSRQAKCILLKTRFSRVLACSWKFRLHSTVQTKRELIPASKANLTEYSLYLRAAEYVQLQSGGKCCTRNFAANDRVCASYRRAHNTVMSFTQRYSPFAGGRHASRNTFSDATVRMNSDLSVSKMNYGGVLHKNINKRLKQDIHR